MKYEVVVGVVFDAKKWIAQTLKPKLLSNRRLTYLWYRRRRKKVRILSSQPRTLRWHSFTTLHLGLLRKFFCIFVFITFGVLYEERGNARFSGEKSLGSKLRGLSTVTLIKNLNDLNYNGAIISRARSKWWGPRSEQQSINMFSIFFSLPSS